MFKGFPKRAKYTCSPSTLPIVSIVVPFRGYLFGILNIKLVKPKNGTTMETEALKPHRYKFMPTGRLRWGVLEAPHTGGGENCQSDTRGLGFRV